MRCEENTLLSLSLRKNSILGFVTLGVVLNFCGDIEMREYQLYVNGGYQPSSSGDTAEIINPATGTTYAAVHQANTDDVARVLDIAWDSRSKKEGGQRWFHIHQDDNVTYDDVLHWSGQNLNSVT